MERYRVTARKNRGSIRPPARVAAALGRKWRLPAFLMAASFLVAGCGGDDGSSGANQAAAASPTRTSTVAGVATLTATVAPQATRTVALPTPTVGLPTSTPSPTPGEGTSTPTAIASTPTVTPSPPTTPSPASCDITNPCPQGSFCELPAGACATDLDSGTCVEVPTTCFDTFEVVCGCDGLTYGNDCIRRAARVSKAFDGACPTEECSGPCDCYATRTFATSCPLECINCGNFWTCEEGRCLEHCGMIPLDLCDQLCSANEACGEDEYCRKPVGQCAGMGACGARPVNCPDFLDPVCGCDGRTYSNECDAANVGVALEHRGACEQVCGTIAGLTCPKGQFCELPAAMCDVADLGGLCADVPGGCPAVIDPVCGCDGITYDNDCERQRAQAQLDQAGPCPGDE